MSKPQSSRNASHGPGGHATSLGILFLLDVRNHLPHCICSQLTFKAFRHKRNPLILQFGDRIDSVRAFFDERDGEWPVVRDDDGGINVSFGVAQVPETFIIDPDGVVRVRWAGALDAETLAKLVQQQRDAYALR